MLGGFGLLLALEVFHNQGHMDENDVFGRFFPVHLADGFQERHALDISHGPADFHQADVSPAPGRNLPNPVLDLVCDVGNDLDSLSQVVTSPLLCDNRLVDLSRGEVMVPGQFRIKEPFVIPEVQVHLTPVFQHENFPVLVGAHCACVNVDVGVDLDSRNFIAFVFQVPTNGRDGDAFSKPAHHTTGNYDILHGSASSTI